MFYKGNFQKLAFYLGVVAKRTCKAEVHSWLQCFCQYGSIENSIHDEHTPPPITDVFYAYVLINASLVSSVIGQLPRKTTTRCAKTCAAKELVLHNRSQEVYHFNHEVGEQPIAARRGAHLLIYAKASQSLRRKLCQGCTKLLATRSICSQRSRPRPSGR